MRHRVRQVEKERFVTIRLEKLDRLFGVPLGEQTLVRLRFDHLFAAHERQRRIIVLGVRRVAHVIGERDAEIRIEAVVCRQVLRQMSEMPFSNAGRGVSSGLETFGDSHFALRQAGDRIGE